MAGKALSFMPMNQWDVDDCKPSTNILCRAASCLLDYKNLIQDISDGWAYWHYGVKCSYGLQKLLSTPPCAQKQVTKKQVDAAIRKVVLFLTRCRYTKDNPRVHEFLKVWR